MFKEMLDSPNKIIFNDFRLKDWIRKQYPKIKHNRSYMMLLIGERFVHLGDVNYDISSFPIPEIQKIIDYVNKVCTLQLQSEHISEEANIPGLLLGKWEYIYVVASNSKGCSFQAFNNCYRVEYYNDVKTWDVFPYNTWLEILFNVRTSNEFLDTYFYNKKGFFNTDLSFDWVSRIKQDPFNWHFEGRKIEHYVDDDVWILNSCI